MRTKMSTLVLTASLLTLASGAGAQQPVAAPPPPPMSEKCTRCHSDARVLRADPAHLEEIVNRMERKSPEAFRGTDLAALKAELASVLSDPKITAGRVAWDETVAKGKAVFNDPSLGSTGKSCASCHQADGLKGVAERYPEFDAKLGRLVDLQERLRIMIETKLNGKQLPLGDFRTVALEAYIKSLR